MVVIRGAIAKKKKEKRRRRGEEGGRGFVPVNHFSPPIQ